LRVAVGPLRLGEAALAKARVALEGGADAVDLDQVDADPHQSAASSQRGRSAIELTTMSGTGFPASRSLGRNLPVRTRTVPRPHLCAPPMSSSLSSPTIHVSSGSASTASSAASK